MDDDQKAVFGGELTARLAPRRDHLDDDVDEVAKVRLLITSWTLCHWEELFVVVRSNADRRSSPTRWVIQNVTLEKM